MHPSFSRNNLTSTAHLAIAGVTLALSLTLFGVVAYGTRASDSAATVAAESLSGKLGQQQMLIKAVRLANTTRAQRAALQAIPILQDGGAGFIAAVEDQGRHAGVSVSVTSVQATPKKGNFPGALALSVQFAGPFSACIQFVRLIETMPTSLTVSRVTLGYTEGGGSWNGSLNLSSLSFDTP